MINSDVGTGYERQAPSGAGSPGLRLPVEHPFTPFDLREIEQSIPDRFHRQVDHHGDRLAVSADGATLTYAELDRRANQVANTLLTMGGESTGPVALLFGHNASMIVAMLGVLKAGRFYVPIDPRHPADRLVWMLRDSEAKVLLHDNDQAESARVAAGAGVQRIDIEQMLANGRNDRPDISISPDQFSYVMYTSGSTGAPKGVCHVHRDTLHCVRNHTNAMHIAPDDRLTLLASYSFGQSICPTLGALLNGAALCLYDLKKYGIAPLGRWMQDQRITIYHSVASVFRALTATLDPKQRYEHLRIIKLSGETVMATDADLFHRHFSPPCVLHTGMGTSESGIVCLYFPNDRTPRTTSTLPIGFPPDGMEVLLWDEARRPVPNGEVGEIIVRSAYLAQGYWRRPDLTVQRFLADPDGGAERLYRTGDLGRRLPDGSVVHMGRMDFQLSIHGQRVEAAEIEAAINAHDAVRESVVVMRKGMDGSERLTAYIVPEMNRDGDVNTIRSSLAPQLPAYMIPSTYVLLDQLPRNVSGKVDRNALPGPEAQSTRPGETPFEPSTATLRKLTALWARSLRMDHVDPHDDYFELGGNSLAAAELVAQICRELGVELSMLQFLERPTIAGIAEWCERDSGVSPETCEGEPTFVRFREGDGGTPLFMMGGEDNMWGLAALARHLDPRCPAYGIEPPEINARFTSFSVEGLAARCIGQIRRVQPQGPYYLIGHCFGGWVLFEVSRQLQRQGERVGLLVMMECFNRRSADQFAMGNVIAYRLGLWRRLGSHWRAMGRHDGGRLAYLRRRAAAFTRSFTTDLSQSGYELAVRRGWRLPRVLRKTVYAHRHAVTLYQPGAYDGPTLLVHVRKEDLAGSEHPFTRTTPAESVWGKVLTGGVEELLINAEREQMWYHPHIRNIGEQLDAQLAAAQQAQSGDWNVGVDGQ